MLWSALFTIFLQFKKAIFLDKLIFLVVVEERYIFALRKGEMSDCEVGQRIIFANNRRVFFLRFLG